MAFYRPGGGEVCDEIGVFSAIVPCRSEGVDHLIHESSGLTIRIPVGLIDDPVEPSVHTLEKPSLTDPPSRDVGREVALISTLPLRLRLRHAGNPGLPAALQVWVLADRTSLFVSCAHDFLLKKARPRITPGPAALGAASGSAARRSRQAHRRKPASVDGSRARPSRDHTPEGGGQLLGHIVGVLGFLDLVRVSVERDTRA